MAECSGAALQPGRASESEFLLALAADGLVLAIIIALTLANRRRIERKLEAFGGIKADRSAATLAALVGGGADDEATVARAGATFRLLPFSSLRGAADLPGSGSGPSDLAQLQSLARSEALGEERSVFVSHCETCGI